jgi:hypothetical protein
LIALFGKEMPQRIMEKVPLLWFINPFFWVSWLQETGFSSEGPDQLMGLLATMLHEMGVKCKETL